MVATIACFALACAGAAEPFGGEWFVRVRMPDGAHCQDRLTVTPLGARALATGTLCGELVTLSGEVRSNEATFPNGDQAVRLVVAGDLLSGVAGEWTLQGFRDAWPDAPALDPRRGGVHFEGDEELAALGATTTRSAR